MPSSNECADTDITAARSTNQDDPLSDEEERSISKSLRPRNLVNDCQLGPSHINSLAVSVCDAAELTRLLKNFRGAARFRNAITKRSSVINRKGPTKPRRTYRKTYYDVNSHTAKLSGVMTAPLDVFYEIAANLHPLDLLHLSRANHQLRSILMSKRSRRIWCRAQSAILLPDCPSDLNEPQYASLLFDRDCQICDGGPIRKTNYVLRLRACEACYEANMVQGRLIKMEISVDNEVFALLPTERELKGFSKIPHMRRFFRPDLVNMNHIYNLLASDPVGRRKFVLDMQRQRDEVIKHSVELQEWKIEYKKQLAEEKKQRMQRRVSQIHASLREIGYTDVDLEDHDDMHRLRWQALTEQNYEFTSNVWLRIRPELEYIIDARKETKYEERRSEISMFYDAYLEKLSLVEEEEAFIPSTEQLLLFPFVETLVQNDDQRTTKSLCKSLKKQLPDLFETYKQNLIKNAECLLIAAYDGLIDLDIPATKFKDKLLSQKLGKKDKLFTLASSFFLCDAEEEHQLCLTVVHDLHAAIIHEREHKAEATRSLRLKSDPITLYLASRLLQSMGLPISITMENMKDPNLRLQCLCCDPIFRRNMSWQQLVNHFRQERLWFEEASLLSAESAELDVMILDDHNIDHTGLCRLYQTPDERFLDDEILVTTHPRFSCELCSRLDLNLTQLFSTDDEVKAHIRSKHGADALSTHMHYSGFVGSTIRGVNSLFSVFKKFR